MKKEIQGRPRISLLISFLLCLSIIFVGMISVSHADVSGPWEGSVIINIPRVGINEMEPFADVFYQEGDALYIPVLEFFIPSTELCDIAGSVVLSRPPGGDTFSLASPISCSYSYEDMDFELTVDSFFLTFSNDDSSFTGTFSGTGAYSEIAFPVPFNGSSQGSRLELTAQLINNVPVPGLAGSEGSFQAFYIDVPADTSGIGVTTSGGPGDSDLYLIYSQLPFYWEASWEDNNEESISVTNPVPGIWYVIVEAWEDFEGVTLTYTADASPDFVIPVPTGQQIIPYAPVSTPELNYNPSQAKPVGIGPLASGGDMLNVQIGLNRTSALVDIYVAYIMGSNPLVVNVLSPDGSFVPFQLSDILKAMSTGIPLSGLQPWMPSTVGPVDVDLLNISTSSLPLGGYSAFLFVTQAGVMNNYYLWTTVFNIL